MKYEDFEPKKFEKESGKKTVHVIINDRMSDEPDHREWVPWNLKAFLRKKTNFLIEGMIIREDRTLKFDIRTTKSQVEFYRKIESHLEEDNGKYSIIRVEIEKD